MIKTISILLISLLFVAHAAESTSRIDNSLFQTVSAKEAILLQDGDKKRYCSRCGMDLVKFFKTSHSASIDDKVYQYCSINCLVEHLYSGVSVDDPQVVDIKSLKFIDIRAAYYVVGSAKKGTMTRTSKYAFSSENDAKEFKSKYGGEIMNFYEAMEVVKKDFQ